MATVFMTDPATGRCALYDEPVGTGDYDDPNSARNAPLNNVSTNLQYIYFHSDLDPMEVAIDTGPITINHATIPASAVPPSDASGAINGQTYGGYTADYAVYSHNLGYVPDFLGIVDDDILSPAYPIQSASDGRCRFVTFYATTTQIKVYEIAMQTGNPLPSTSINYSFLILSPQPTPSGNILMNVDPSTGVVSMGRGKFRSDRKYLQIVSGGSPFALPTGKTVDLNNGTFRSISASGVVRDIVPNTFRLSIGAINPDYGPSGNYKGSFAGETVIQVQAP